MNYTQHNFNSSTILPDSDGESVPCPTVMTEEELIRFLRTPEISCASNHHYVIENLKRRHGLPRIHLCGKAVYLTDSVKQWLHQHDLRRSCITNWARRLPIQTVQHLAGHSSITTTRRFYLAVLETDCAVAREIQSELMTSLTNYGPKWAFLRA